MRKLVFAVMALVASSFVVSCDFSEDKKQADAADSVQVDSVASDTTANDTVLELE